MDRYQRLIDKVADLEALLADLKVELREYAEDTDRDRAEEDAGRRRRGMHSLAVIPAAVAGTTALARDNPLASGVLALTACTAMVALVYITPSEGGGVPHGTAPGVIAEQQQTAPTEDLPPRRNLRRPEMAPPVSLRPPWTAPGVRPAAEVLAVDLKPVRVRPPRRAVEKAFMAPMAAAAKPRGCGARVRVIDLDVRLCRLGVPPLQPHMIRREVRIAGLPAAGPTARRGQDRDRHQLLEDSAPAGQG